MGNGQTEKDLCLNKTKKETGEFFLKESKNLKNPFDIVVSIDSDSEKIKQKNPIETPFLDEIINDFKKPNFGNETKQKDKPDFFHNFQFNKEQNHKILSKKLNQNKSDDETNSKNQNPFEKVTKNPFENFI